MALLTAPAPEAPPVTRGELGRRLAARARSTPGRLTVTMLVLLALGLLTGVAGVVGAAQRSSLVDGVRTQSGPLAVRAQQLYRSLSDADATAASAFLSNGVEPPALRKRYQDDIAAAGGALAAVTAGGVSDQPAVQRLAAQLPVYTGLVETARTVNRSGLPLGAAYLREASALMRDQLLPAAEQLYRAESDRLAADRAGATGFPWVALPYGLLTLAILVRAQQLLSRRTRRTFNVGLVGATLAVLAMVVWTGVAWLAGTSHLTASDRDGSAQVELLAKARIAALQARADEALTLVAHGNGAGFEKDFATQMQGLAGAGSARGLLDRAGDNATDPVVRAEISAAIADLNTWRTVHRTLRERDDGGQFPDAVKLAIGTEPDSAASVFNKVDGHLDKAIAVASAAFDRQATAAAGALGGGSIGL